MPKDEVTISRRCSNCGTEIEVVAVKKDNMMLMTAEKIWCPKCQADTKEVRDLSGRSASIEQEQGSYAANNAVDPEMRH